MRSLIDMAADRGAFIDQSQSLNLFMESPTIGKLSLDVPARLEAGPQDDVLPALAARRPASPRPPRRAPATHHPTAPPTPPVSEMPTPRPYTDDEAVACSLENPESCEACQ